MFNTLFKNIKSVISKLFNVLFLMREKHQEQHTDFCNLEELGLRSAMHNNRVLVNVQHHDYLHGNITDDERIETE